MAYVVLLRGVNVGGHRTFSPARLANQLRHLDVVNIGAAGTFVVRRPIMLAELRTEIARRLPFEAKIIIVDGRAILRLMARDHFADEPARSDVVQFVSVLARRSRLAPSIPMVMPTSGRWQLKIVSRDDRFILGVYRRHMKAIGHLGTLDRLFDVPITTRSWTTIARIAKVLNE